jgi:SAM-dependent methyltransferase
MSLSVPYALGGTRTERQRLVTQGRGLEAYAEWIFDQIGINPGDRTVDVGCGPIGVVNLLSARVGSEGAVVGIEREQRFAEMAQAEVNKRGLRNTQIINADAINTGLEKGSYDVVHERLVLINVPSATIAVRRCAERAGDGACAIPDSWRLSTHPSAITRRGDARSDTCLRTHRGSRVDRSHGVSFRTSRESRHHADRQAARSSLGTKTVLRSASLAAVGSQRTCQKHRGPKQWSCSIRKISLHARR